MYQLCGSYSVIGHNHRKVIGQDPIWADLQGMGLGLSETVEQKPCVMREIKTWLSDSRVGYNRVVDHRNQRPVLSPLHSCVDRWQKQTIRHNKNRIYSNTKQKYFEDCPQGIRPGKNADKMKQKDETELFAATEKSSS